MTCICPGYVSKCKHIEAEGVKVLVMLFDAEYEGPETSCKYYSWKFKTRFLVSAVQGEWTENKPYCIHASLRVDERMSTPWTGNEPDEAYYEFAQQVSMFTHSGRKE